MEPEQSPTESEDNPSLEVEGLPTRGAAQGTRSSPGWLLRQAGLVALVCLVAGGVLAHELGATMHGRTSIPAPRGPVVLLSNVSYGTVTLNGRRLPGSPPLVLPMRLGANIILFDAHPFLPRACHVIWGADGGVSGDCTAIGPFQINDVVIDGLVIRPSIMIVARMSGGDLPPRLFAAASAAVERDLAAVSGSSWVVPAGEPIATGGHWPDAIASRPAFAGTLATVDFGLFDDMDEPRPLSCDFRPCAGDLFFTTASASRAPVWNVAPDAYYLWHFVDGAGRRETSLPYPVSPSVNVPLRYDDVAGWQPPLARVSGGFPLPTEVLLDGTFCNAGVFVLNALTQTLTGPITTVVGNSGPIGCVIALVSKTQQPLGRFIWRWGVLLAADADAHDLLTALPVASASAIAAVGP